MGGLDRGFRSNEFRYSASDRKRRSYEDAAPASAYDCGYRDKFRFVGASERWLEIMKGSAFSASTQAPFAAGPTPPRWSPEPPLPRHSRSRRSSSTKSSAWCFSDPEAKRRWRVASYKAYAAESKMKASVRKGLRWIKVKCSQLVHGW